MTGVALDLGDELAHEPGDHPAWQESAVLTWWDEERGVGGYQHLAQEPHSGQANLMSGIVTADGRRYRSYVGDLSLGADDRDGQLAAGPLVFSVPGPHNRWEVTEDDCDLVLDFHDFYPPHHWSPKGGGLAELAAGHFEGSGRVTGRLRLGDEAIEVDGLGHRDHSWGPRVFEQMLSHRWVGGTCGPALSFSVLVLHTADDTITTAGFVARGREITDLAQAEVVVAMEPDGLSVRGGSSEVALVDGTALRIDANVIDGLVFGHGSFVGTENISRVHVGERLGFCDLNVSNNPRAGARQPTMALRANLTPGLSMR